MLRQLNTLQQSINTGQTGELDIDKLRKLQEMKQQEEEFDKHLAQTVPVINNYFFVFYLCNNFVFRICHLHQNANLSLA